MTRPWHEQASTSGALLYLYFLVIGSLETTPPLPHSSSPRACVEIGFRPERFAGPKCDRGPESTTSKGCGLAALCGRFTW
jgi:hypothetical protein